MAPLADEAIRALIVSDPQRGWRAFIDQYTPLILGLIRRGGVTERDEMMEVYVLVCEQLSARGFERLKTQDASRGSLGGWLAVIIRHTIVDWLRSRKGRRRLFQTVADLPRLEQRVFELFYWDDRTPSEIAELLSAETGARVGLAAVMEALERVQETLTDRHRAELLALAVRSKPAVALDDVDAAQQIRDTAVDPETRLRIREMNSTLERALSRLAPEDAAIVRLKFVEGLSNGDIERALGITGLTTKRVQQILSSLRAALSVIAAAGDSALARHITLDRSTS